MICTKSTQSFLINTGLLLAAGLYFPCVFACAPEEFPGQLQGNYTVDVSSDQPKLLLIKQRGADLILQLDGSSPGWLNSPSGRNGTDFVFVETENSEATKELCFYSVYNFSAKGTYRVQELSLPGLDEDTRKVLRLFNQAGSAWMDGGSQATELAASLYQQLIDSRIEEFLGDPDSGFFLRFSAAMSNFRLRRYSMSSSFLSALESEPYRSHPNFYQALWQSGRLHLRQGNIPAAIPYLEEALTLTSAPQLPEQTALQTDRADISSVLIDAYSNDLQFEAAELRFEEALVAANADFEMLGKIFNNASFLSLKQSEVPGLDKEARSTLLSRSVEQLLRASYFAAEAGEFSGYQIIENNLAVRYAEIGERRKSIIHFLNVLKLLEEIDNPESRAFLYSNLSNYSQILGDYNKAAVYLQQGMQLSGDSDSREIASYHCRMGSIYRNLERPEPALTEHQLCLDLAEANADFATRAEALLQLSLDHSAQASLSEAQDRIEAAAVLLSEIDDYNLVRRIRTQQATILLWNGQVDEALLAIDAALASTIDDRYPNDEIAALTTAARIHRALGNIEVAQGHALEALTKIESLHVELEAERMGPAWSNQTDEVYSLLADIYLEQYRQSGDLQQLALAFQTSERSRDISLRQRLAAQLPNDSASLEVQKQLELFSSIASLLAGTGQAIPQPASLNYYHQHDLLSLARLNNIGRLPIPSPFNLEDVQAKLQPEQLALYYLVTDDALSVLAITHDSFHLKSAGMADELEALLAESSSLLHTPGSFSTERLQALSSYLLPDMSSYPDTTELLIIGHNALYAVPFAALPLPSGSNEYQPLAGRYTLTTLPSLSIYFMDKPQSARDYLTEVAILADPVFDNLQFADPDESLASAGSLRGWSQSLQALPYTAEEARDVESKISGRTVAFTGPSATRANLSSAETRNARVLHIATHGYFKSTSEDNIGLALSTVDEAGNPDPGFITLTELFGYAFNNELVVISGCDTAMGKEQAGVGFNSLSRGFLAQGVKHVIATLWPVSDRASAEFMGIFYERLQAEKNVTLALQQTQQALSRMPAYRNPYYWAGYTLTSVTPDAVIALSD